MFVEKQKRSSVAVLSIYFAFGHNSNHSRYTYQNIILGGFGTMPVYEYICRECGKISEFKATLAEKEQGLEQTCPKCGSANMVQYFGNMIVIASTHLH